MIDEKVMVNDVLSSVKSSLTFYANTISECANPELRSAIQQIRNNDEASQYQLFQMAQAKGYYKPALMAKDDEIQQTKSQVTGQ
ncbi:spore coat protein [Desulfitobacterium hafniense]|uniref:spore coat protein n=1 Tax=Desulfitobacterium hafniense TaxID=49338 RepID=UPI000369270A|nr:spore coat protein [Desulfitobacterium hafniense]